MDEVRQAKMELKGLLIWSDIPQDFLRGIRGFSGSFPVAGGPTSASAGVGLQE